MGRQAEPVGQRKSEKSEKKLAGLEANAPSHFVERVTGIQQRQGSPAPIFE
jgi:hypothetical protein